MSAALESIDVSIGLVRAEMDAVDSQLRNAEARVSEMKARLSVLSQLLEDYMYARNMLASRPAPERCGF